MAAEISASERQHQEDIQRAVQIHVDSPWLTVTPEKLKAARIRAWRHHYCPAYVSLLVEHLYGTE